MRKKSPSDSEVISFRVSSEMYRVIEAYGLAVLNERGRPMTPGEASRQLLLIGLGKVDRNVWQSKHGGKMHRIPNKKELSARKRKTDSGAVDIDETVLTLLAGIRTK